LQHVVKSVVEILHTLSHLHSKMQFSCKTQDTRYVPLQCNQRCHALEVHISNAWWMWRLTTHAVDSVKSLNSNLFYLMYTVCIISVVLPFWWKCVH